MKTVADCVNGPVVLVSPALSVAQAARLLHRHRQACLPVVDRGRLVGLFSVWEACVQPPTRLVGDVMVRSTASIAADAPVWHAWRAFSRSQHSYLAVVDHERVVGVLSRTRVELEVARHVDPLTDLPRPELLKFHVESWLKADEEVAVIFLDMDDFGVANKLVGHVAADEALRQAARVLRHQVDPDREQVGRFGGDEFLVVTRRRAAEAFQLAVRLVQALNSSLRAGRLALSVSAGVAGGRRERAHRDVALHRMLDDLINLASLRSTEAKKRGLDVVSDDRVHPPLPGRQARAQAQVAAELVGESGSIAPGAGRPSGSRSPGPGCR